MMCHFLIPSFVCIPSIYNGRANVLYPEVNFLSGMNLFRITFFDVLTERNPGVGVILFYKRKGYGHSFNPEQFMQQRKWIFAQYPFDKDFPGK